MQFVATFNVDVKFNDPAKFAAFAAAFEKLYGDFFSADAPPRQTQAATLSPAAPRPAPPAPSTSEDMGADRVMFPAPTPQEAATAALDPAGVPCGAETTEAAAPAVAVKQRRPRATKAEMAARRAAEAAGEPNLPKPHGGSNTGTTPPLPVTLPVPTPDALNDKSELQMPEGEIGAQDVADMLARLFMLRPDVGPEVSSQLLSPLQLGRMRDAKPEHYRTLCEGMVRLSRGRS